MKTLALDGLRVLDLSRLLPGPYCTSILNSFGAEVIRIEPPEGGDWLRDAAKLDESMRWLFQALNSGKKSITLDLKTEAGKRIMLSLVMTADVLFETFRPGVMEMLGLGYQELSEPNPGLIYCSLTGYGGHGPYRDRVGHDLNYIGLTGLLDLTGSVDGPPVIPATQVADIMGGLWAVIGILAALKDRDKTGRGIRVEGSFLGSALASLRVALSRNAGGNPMRRGEGELSGEQVCYNVYETKDQHHMTLAALEPKFWTNFCRLVSKEHLIFDQFSRATPGEPTYDELCVLFGGRTQHEWVEFFGEEEVCCEPVYSLEEGLASDPVQSLGILSDKGLLPPLKFSSQNFNPLGPAPELGQHTAELLTELGFSNKELEALREEGVV